MEWTYLILAGAFEVVAVTGMNEVSKLRNLRAFTTFLGGLLLSFGFLSLAMQALPMGTSYAVWTGIGAIGGTLVGLVFYKESHDWRRLLFICMILIATIGLKLTA